jgi:chromosome segregation ATPase
MRAEDLIAEIAPRLRSLRRQAKKMEERAVVEQELKVYQLEYFGKTFWSLKREIDKLAKAIQTLEEEREQKAIAEKRKVETMKTLSDWLDLTDVTKVDPSLHDAHEILRAAREEKDLAVEETLISLVEQSNISYAEAVKTLAEVIEKKVMKYTSIKALDSKIASRYKKEDTPAPAAPVDSKAKEVLKTIGDKVEEASKHVDTDSIIDRSSMDLSDVLKSIKEKEKRKASNLRRL